MPVSDTEGPVVTLATMQRPMIFGNMIGGGGGCMAQMKLGDGTNKNDIGGWRILRLALYRGN